MISSLHQRNFINTNTDKKRFSFSFESKRLGKKKNLFDSNLTSKDHFGGFTTKMAGWISLRLKKEKKMKHFLPNYIVLN